MVMIGLFRQRFSAVKVYVADQWAQNWAQKVAGMECVSVNT